MKKMVATRNKKNDMMTQKQMESMMAEMQAKMEANMPKSKMKKGKKGK